MTPIRFGIVRDNAASCRFEDALASRVDVELAARHDPSDDTLDSLKASDDLDAIIIDCAPARATDLAVAALSNNLHVLSEHLTGYRVENIINIRRAEAEAPGKVIKFGVAHRYHASIVEARKIADSKALGKLLSVRGLYGRAGDHPDQQDWRYTFSQSGGGVLMDLGLPLLDLMQMFAGPVEEVKSLVDERLGTKRGVEDNVMALLRTNAGVMAMIHASQTQWRQTFRLELGFQEGYIWLDGLLSRHDAFSPEMLIVGRLERDPAGRPMANPTEDIREFTDCQSHSEELDEFIRAIRGQADIKNGNSQQAFDAINVAHRLYAADPSYVHETL